MIFRNRPQRSHHKTRRIYSTLSLAQIPALFATAALITGPAPRARAFAQIARGTLEIQNTAALTYDSFFIGSPAFGDDWYWSDQPLLTFSRKAGLAGISANGGITFTRYDENTRYDSEDWTGGLTITLPTESGSRINGAIAASYTESTEVDYSVNDRIPTRALNGNFNLTCQLGALTSLNDVFSYTKLYRDNDAYSDQQLWSNKLGFRYDRFLYGTTLDLDYTFTKTDSTANTYTPVPLDQNDNSFSATATHPIYGDINGSLTIGYHVFHRGAGETITRDTSSSDFYFAIGIDGPFLPRDLFPKLNSHASLYYRDSTSAGIGYGGGRTLTGDISVSWAARPRTQISINANRSTDLNASNYTVTNSTVGLTITENAGDATTITVGANYRWSEYQGIRRNDDFFSTSASVGYKINQYWNTSLSYTYQDNQNVSEGPQPVPNSGRSYSRQLVTSSIVCKF